MDPNKVILIGVNGERLPDGSIYEGFVYSEDAHTNLWCSTICDDGSRMPIQMAAKIINLFLLEDKFLIGDTVDYDGSHIASLQGIITEVVYRDDEGIDAFQCRTNSLLKIEVKIKEYFDNPHSSMQPEDAARIFEIARAQYAEEGVTGSLAVLERMRQDAPNDEVIQSEWEMYEMYAKGKAIEESTS